MKTIIILWILLFTSHLAFTNDIEKLEFNAEVQNFLVKKVNRKWKGIDFFEYTGPEDASMYGKVRFVKIDLDNNGLTDLIVNGNYFFAVTDKGNGNYGVHFIDGGPFNAPSHTLKNIVYENQVPILVVADFNKSYLPIEGSTKTDSLILKYGEFYEYNSTPDHFKIEEIRIATSYCLGTCAVFELTLKSNGQANYHAIQYNERKGKFHAIVDSATIHAMFRTINYIKLTSLKDQYNVSWTDDQTATLEIKFNNGQVKKIIDYGKIGSFGLLHLYEQLFALRLTQKWKREKHLGRLKSADDQ
ncbi:MAG: hypothetical protein HYZ44_15305 [Bacteroidetes bacterium]|nr:hypothetical protein [Bacteroidota bacterium]